MNTYSIFKKSKKSILWGSFDSEFVFNDLKKHIVSSKNVSNDIELDFKGIKSIDYSFINEVFVKLIQDLDNNDFNFIFKNIENDAILYYLNQTFQKRNLIAHFKINETKVSIGNESCVFDSI